MGNPREETMWKWIDDDRPQREKDYTAYLKAAVNVEGFVDGCSLLNFWEWCLANQPTKLKE